MMRCPLPVCQLGLLACLPAILGEALNPKCTGLLARLPTAVSAEPAP